MKEKIRFAVVVGSIVLLWSVFVLALPVLAGGDPKMQAGEAYAVALEDKAKAGAANTTQDNAKTILDKNYAINEKLYAKEEAGMTAMQKANYAYYMGLADDEKDLGTSSRNSGLFEAARGDNAITDGDTRYSFEDYVGAKSWYETASKRYLGGGGFVGAKPYFDTATTHYQDADMHVATAKSYIPQ